MSKLGDSPLIKQVLNQSRSLTGGLREAADTHNSGIKTLLGAALKAQAELYKGQLAVIEHFIGKLNPQPAPPPASRVQPTAARTSVTPAETLATPAAPAAPVASAATTLARAQAIAAAAAATPPIRPTTSTAADGQTAPPAPFPSK
jgi:predicted lipid-binding transport protein (Tim44 family)